MIGGKCKNPIKKCTLIQNFKGGEKMSNDISTMFTKDQNKKAGRKGFFHWKSAKITAISPAAYGDYILQSKRRGKKGANYDRN